MGGPLEVGHQCDFVRAAAIPQGRKRVEYGHAEINPQGKAPSVEEGAGHSAGVGARVLVRDARVGVESRRVGRDADGQAGDGVALAGRRADDGGGRRAADGVGAVAGEAVQVVDVAAVVAGLRGAADVGGSVRDEGRVDAARMGEPVPVPVGDADVAAGVAERERRFCGAQSDLGAAHRVVAGVGSGARRVVRDAVARGVPAVPGGGDGGGRAGGIGVARAELLGAATKPAVVPSGMARTAARTASRPERMGRGDRLGGARGEVGGVARAPVGGRWPNRRAKATRSRR
jgi:hypothetical protein